MHGKQILETLDHIPEVTDYPDVDGLILKDIYRYKLEEDGRVSHYHYQFKRIFKDFERDRKSDVRILFNQKFQEVTVLAARSIMLDGQVVDTPEYGINQITPPNIQKSPYFTDFQAKVVSLVGLEVGGYTEIEYEVTDKQTWRPAIYGTIPLQLHVPVLSREIIFEFPEKRAITFSIEAWTGAEIEPETVTENGVTRVTYNLDTLPHWDDEDNHNLSTADCPKLMFSEHSSWDDMSNYFYRLVDTAAGSDEHLEKRVKELLKDIECPYQSCLRINKHVTSAMATVDFDPLDNCHAVRPAREILASGYGTSIEKAILMAEMVRIAGFPAEVAMACPIPALPQHVFHLGLFQEAWVRVQSLQLFMRSDKPVSKARREHLEGRKLLIAVQNETDHNQLEIMDTGQTLGNRCHIKVDLTLKKDATMSGSLVSTMSGIYNPYFALSSEETDKVNDWVKGYAKKCWSGAELDKHHFQLFAPSHTSLNLNFSVKHLEKNRENRYAFTFPGFLTTFGGFKIPHQYLTRSSTYELPGTLQQTVKWTIEIPDDFEITMKPAPVNITTDVAKFEQTCELKEEKGKPVSLIYVQTVKMTSRFVTPDQYPAFRNIVIEDLRTQNRMLFLSRK